MSQICCKCGKSEKEEPIVDGFCLSCYKDEFPLISSFYEKQFNLTACKLCGDFMYHGKWTEVHDDPKKIVLEFLGKFLNKTKKETDARVVLVGDFEEPSCDLASKQILKIIFEGTPNDKVPPYQQEYDLTLMVNIGVCDRCAKFTRGYFETIVQIRSDRRPINEEEQLQITNLIQQKKDSRAGENRMAYIAKVVDQAKGGIDLYVGSDKFAKTITSFLSENLAASIEYSTKLKSMKDGKPIYQSTYCIRMPYFELGDVVSYQNNACQIIGIKQGRVEIQNLKTRENKTLSIKNSHPDYVKVLKKKDQFQKYIVAAIQAPNASVMNTASYETVDIDINMIFENHQDGDEILMVELPDGLFECKEI